MIRRLLAAGAGAGVLAGAIAAVAIPQTAPPPPASGQAATPLAGAAPVVSDVRRVGRMRSIPDVGYPRLRPVGAVRVTVRALDPRGGPDWAVREFLADRLAPPSSGRGRAGAVIGRNRCAQLGRLHRGRFGWLEAGGTFRPVGLRFVGAPTQCVSRRADLGRRGYAEVLTTITEPQRPAAEPVQTVVWGVAGPSARAADLTIAGAAAPVERGRAGTLLAVLGPEVRSADVVLTVSTASGSHRLLGRSARRSDLPAPLRDRVQQPAPGARPELAAQAPDPDGGLPYAMTAVRSRQGGWCTAIGGRVVGDRAGGVDYALDLLREGTGIGTNCPALADVSRGRLPDGRTLPPYSLMSSWGGGFGAEAGEDPAPGRIARRTLLGRVILSGVAESTVRSLTFASPSDVRTIEPAGPARAFLVVYAGSFPTGRLVITTTFEDGRTRRDEQPLGF